MSGLLAEGGAVVDIADLGEMARVGHVWGCLGRRSSAHGPGEKLRASEHAPEGSGWR